MSGKKYRNATDFIEDILEAEEDFESLKQQMQSRQIVKALATIRVERGLTQKNVADVMGQTQGKISRIENGVDADLKISDIVSYAKATGIEITMLLSDRNQSLVARVKHHALEIQMALVELSKLAHQDDEIARGVAKFHVEAFCNITRLLAEAAKKLPGSNNRVNEDHIRVVDEFTSSSRAIESENTENNSEEQHALL